MSLRERTERAWADPPSGGRLFRAGLGVLEAGFRAGVRLRSALYDRGILPVVPGPIPVISVGNVTVGGTGKTPLVRWVVQTLKDHGSRPAVVLRGYGGDETLLHRRWHPDVSVIEGADRVRSVREAAAAGATTVVCDDAFQHRRLFRDLDIVLISADTPPSRRLLPAGPYRESFHALGRADIICLTQKGAATGRAESVTQDVRMAGCTAPIVPVKLVPSGWTKLDGSATAPPEGAVVIVTAVGSPASVESTVRAAVSPRGETPSLEVEVLVFPDHHAFTQADVARCVASAGSRPIVVTEKDAVKLDRFPELTDRTWVIGLAVADSEDLEPLRERVTGVIHP